MLFDRFVNVFSVFHMSKSVLMQGLCIFIKRHGTGSNDSTFNVRELVSNALIVIATLDIKFSKEFDGIVGFGRI